MRFRVFSNALWFSFEAVVYVVLMFYHHLYSFLPLFSLPNQLCTPPHQRISWSWALVRLHLLQSQFKQSLYLVQGLS